MTNDGTSSSNLHHPELYFHDGNFVIIAQDVANKTDRIHFRVHQTILSKHSQVFKDMFTLPGPPADAQELYDGVAFVDVNDDPEDMAKFLTVLYEPLYVNSVWFQTEYLRDLILGQLSTSPIAKDEPDAAFTMFGVLKLADKFMVEPLKEIILSHIRLDWPKSLKKWDQRQEKYRARFKRQNQTQPCRWAPDPASVIRVARLCDPTLLPLVFYQLSTLRREDVGDTREIFSDPPSAVARWTLLSQQDELCIERGRLAMMMWIMDQFDSIDFEDWDCPGDHDCHLRMKARLVEVHRRIMRKADPLKMLDMLTKIDEEEGDFENNKDYWSGEMPDTICEDCDKDWKSSIPPIRLDLFNSLGSFFPTS